MKREIETGALGKFRKSVAARVIAGGIALAAVGGAAAGCGGAAKEGQSTTTSTGIVSTTTLPETTTSITPTTLNSTTTTIEQTTETTVPSLISKDKTIADVKAQQIPAGKEITTPINVSSSLQAEFGKLFPDQKILYIGPNNRGPKDSLTGNELNDSIVTVGGQGSEKGLNYPHFGGIGATKGENGETVFLRIVMEFKDIVKIPGSDDYYIHGIDPEDNNADIFVRIVASQTEFLCFDLNNPQGFDYGESKDFPKDKHLASNISPEKFFIPGDTVDVSTQASVIKIDKNTAKLSFATDENKAQTAQTVGVVRYSGADQINALFK